MNTRFTQPVETLGQRRVVPRRRQQPLNLETAATPLKRATTFVQSSRSPDASTGGPPSVNIASYRPPELPIERGMPMRVSNSILAAESFRNTPRNALVVVHEPGFFTPR